MCSGNPADKPSAEWWEWLRADLDERHAQMIEEGRRKKEALRKLLESELSILPHVDDLGMHVRIREISLALDKIIS